MAGVNVKSEIKPLKKVLLHRPGKELLNLTPNTLEELLFDDIPFLKVAQEEHDGFAQALRDNGVEVVYLEDLTAEVLAADPELREKFLLQWIDEAGIKTERYRKIIFDYMQENYPDAKDFVLKTMEGINLTELHTDKSNSLVDLVSEASKMVVAPMPNLYFTRDPFAMIGNGVPSTACTPSPATVRPSTASTSSTITRTSRAPRSTTAATTPSTSKVATSSTSTSTCWPSASPSAPSPTHRRIATTSSRPHLPGRHHLGIQHPDNRAMMHLDTVFTQIDVDKFTIHPGIMGPLSVFEITPEGDGIKVHEINAPLEQILEKYIACR